MMHALQQSQQQSAQQQQQPLQPHVALPAGWPHGPSAHPPAAALFGFPPPLPAAASAPPQLQQHQQQQQSAPGPPAVNGAQFPQEHASAAAPSLAAHSMPVYQLLPLVPPSHGHHPHASPADPLQAAAAATMAAASAATAQYQLPPQPPPQQLSPTALSARISALLQSAEALRLRGAHRDALSVYAEVLQLDPTHVSALNLIGTCHRSLGDSAAAMRCYEQALRLQPADWIAYNNLGICYKELCMYAEAIACYEQAVATGPPTCVARENLSVAKCDLGTRHKLEGRADVAAACYAEALALNPNYYPALFNLGVIYSEQGDMERALESYMAAVAKNPNYCEALCNVGVIHKNSGRLEMAIEYYSRALKSNPNFAIAASNLSIAKTDLGTRVKNEGRLDEGLRHYKEALSYNSKYPAAWYNLGVAYAEKHRYDDAKVCYEMAVLFDAKCAEAYNNLGVIYKDRGNLDMALHHYGLALSANPHFAQTHNNLSVIYTMLGRLDEAHEYCARAIAANPLYAEAHNNLGVGLSCRQCGVLYRDEGRIEESIRSYSQCLAIDPSSRNAGQNRLLALNSVCGNVALHTAVATSAEADSAAANAAALEVWQAHRAWGQAFAAQYASARHLSWPNAKTLNRPLRIGYMSADFFTHSVSYFIAAPLAHADRNQTFVVCYSNVARRDAKTDMLQSYAHAWRQIHDKSAKEVAAMIRDDAIDILVELTGHTGGNRLDVMALKPAPVQVTWIGYPNSTGLPTIDYRLTDGVVDPEDTEQQHSEELVRLPSCFLCYTPPLDAPPVSPTPALTKGFVTFGSFNNLAKLNDRVLARWCAILQAVPTSRMLLKCKPFASASVVTKTLARFAALGVDPSRVDCIPLLASTGEHLSAYSAIDIAIDTYPYAGTTTTCEALFCGVPVVTYARSKPNVHAHNVGKTLLTRIEGAQKLIANSEEEYVSISVALAGDIPSLQSLRASLRPAMLRSSLCDGPAFVAGLTAVYQKLWQRYCLTP